MSLESMSSEILQREDIKMQKAEEPQNKLNEVERTQDELAEVEDPTKVRMPKRHKGEILQSIPQEKQDPKGCRLCFCTTKYTQVMCKAICKKHKICAE